MSTVDSDLSTVLLEWGFGPERSGIPAAIHAFRAEHREWSGRFPPDEPIYALPATAINALARSTRRDGSPLLAPSDVRIERAFTEFCHRENMVGVWADQPIWCGLFPRPVPDPDPEEVREHWSQADVLRHKRLRAMAPKSLARLHGVAGWLLTDPDFLRERNALRAREGELPTICRYRALSRPDKTGRIFPGADPVGEEFGRILSAFLDRWGLVKLATWDLPEPQGPFLPSELPPGAPALPRHGVHIVVPVHYPLIGADEVLRMIEAAQRGLAGRLKMDPAGAGLPNHKLYARLFRAQHIERAICNRFPDPAPRGVVECVVRAVAADLRVKRDRVTKYRKMVSSRLRRTARP